MSYATMDLARAIEHVAAHGTYTTETDVAVKTSWQPVLSALFDEVERAEYFHPGGGLRYEKREEFYRSLGDRIFRVAKGVFDGNEEEPGRGPQNLSVIADGILSEPPVVFEMDGKGVTGIYAMIRLFNT